MGFLPKKTIVRKRIPTFKINKNMYQYRIFIKYFIYYLRLKFGYIVLGKRFKNLNSNTFKIDY